jgi:hypothetical protein
MKIFLDVENIVDCIAGEMMNMEAVEMLYDNGLPCEKKTLGYPVYKTDTSTIYLECTYGVVFLPFSKNNTTFIDSIIKRLKVMSAEYKVNNKKSHLDRYISITSDHFTTLKIKRETLHERFIDNTLFSISEIYTSIMNASSKFRWFFLPITALLDFQKFENDNQMQIISILYDKNNLFEIGHNVETNTHLCCKTTKYGKFCKDITYLGPAQDVYEKYKKVYKTSILPGISSFIDSYRTERTDPDYESVNFIHSMKINICNIRRCDLEIIRNFGNWNIYNTGKSRVVDITRDIFEIDFGSIKIDNSMHLIPSYDNDRCCVCNTPLYDYFYFLEFKNLRGTAMCGICAHTEFVKTPDGYVYSCSRGNINFTKLSMIKRIFKVKHSRSILDMLKDIDPIISEIIMAARGEMKVKWFRSIKLAYFQGHNHKFIAYSGDRWILYRKFFKKNLNDLDDKTIIFPVNFINI